MDKLTTATKQAVNYVAQHKTQALAQSQEWDDQDVTWYLDECNLSEVDFNAASTMVSS